MKGTLYVEPLIEEIHSAEFIMEYTPFSVIVIEETLSAGSIMEETFLAKEDTFSAEYMYIIKETVSAEFIMEETLSAIYESTFI